MKHSLGNITLNIEDTGAGSPTLLFLHYWGGSHRTWSGVATRLAPSFRCVTYDSRGWGQSDAPETGYSISDLADDADALIQSLKLTNYILIGHSMGGKVAQLLASRKPAGLIGHVLVAPATPGPTHFPPEALEQQLHAYDNRETVLQTIAFLSARTPSPELVQQIVEDSLSGAPAAKLAWPTSGIVEDITAEVTKIDVPTLVLAGELDNLDSVEQHRREILPHIKGSQLQVIPGSGHLIPIDEPEQLASAITGFIAQLPA